MKKMLQNFGSRLFCHHYLQYIICNLARFRNCLEKYTMRSRSCHPAMACLPYWWCSTVLPDGVMQCSFTCLCAWASEGFFHWGH